MKTQCVNPYKQKRFYHLKMNKVRITQTKQRPIIHNKPIINYDELIVDKYDKNDYKEMLKEVSAKIEQEKEFVIKFIELSIGRSLSEKEKQKLMVLI